MATNLFDVSGKVAVVTGGARGIGAMICESLVANGADVVVVSRKAAGCAQFCDALNGRGHRAKATWVSADLSSDAECKRAADEIAKSHKAVHVLINNSGCNWGWSRQSLRTAAANRCWSRCSVGRIPMGCVR